MSTKRRPAPLRGAAGQRPAHDASVAARLLAIRRAPYYLPSPSASEDDYERFHHLDLGGLSPAQRWAESERARAALIEAMAGDDPIIVFDQGHTMRASTWLRERFERASGRVS